MRLGERKEGTSKGSSGRLDSAIYTPEGSTSNQATVTSWCISSVPPILDLVQGGNIKSNAEWQEVPKPRRPFDSITTAEQGHTTFEMQNLNQESTITYSAIEKTPIEVWCMILFMAVQSPLLPRDGDDLVDGTIIFMNGCHSQSRHRRIEALRGRLRLVCRTWNAILEDSGAHCFFLRGDRLCVVQSRHEETRKFRRIEIVHYCNNSCVRGYTRHNDKSLRPLASDALHTSGRAKWIEHVQLGTDASWEPQFLIVTNILNSKPRLRALEIMLHRFSPIQLDFILNHSALSRITHLSIHAVGVKREQELGPCSFPAVRILSISIPHYPPKDSILEWEFPSLAELHLHRAKAEGNHSLFHGLDRFLDKHSKQITSLNIDYRLHVGSIPYPIDAAFWKCFPNLRLFGPGLPSLDQEIAPPPSDSVKSFLLPGVQAPWEGLDQFHFDRYIEPLLQVCCHWQIERLIILSSWWDMGSTSSTVASNGSVVSLSTSGWSPRFFQEATASGIRIFDIDRVPITDLEGMAFLRKLQNIPLR